MGPFARFGLICMLFSHSLFAMQITLDERAELPLNGPLPTLISEYGDQYSPQARLKHSFSFDTFQASTQPNPLSSWHKITLKGEFASPYAQERIINVGTHILRHLNFYLFDGQKLIQHKSLGLLENPNADDDHYTGPTFRFYIQHGQTLTLLIEKQNDGPAILPMTIYSEDGFNQQVRFLDSFWASVISILIAMAIYNVMVYAMHPSSAYLWYLGFHSVAFCYFSALNGFGFLFWPEELQIWLAQNIMFLNFVLIFLVINFADAFLQTKENAPWFHQLIPAFRIISLLGASVSLLLPEYHMIPIFGIYQFLASSFGIAMGFVALKKRFSPARYFLISWIFTLTGGAVGIMTFVNLLPVTFVTLHGFLFGTLLELFLLSIALASRMKHAENSLLNQLYHYPDTNIANFSYIKNKLPELIAGIKREYSNPVMIIADMQGFREVVSLYGPKILSKLYRIHTDRITDFLSQQSWSIPLPMPTGKPVYVVALPAEQILCIVNLPQQPLQIGLADVIDNLILETEGVLNSKQLTSRIQFTLGCASFKDQDVETTFRQAQIALLSSIKQKSKWLMYTDEQNETISQRISLAHDLQLAINQNDLSVYIQPQVNLEDEQVCGGEILLRWNHPKRGSISPARFIPLAEQSGLVYQITQLVFIKCCRWLQQMKNKNLLKNNFTISINLSALDMTEPKLVPFIEAGLRQFNLESKWFVLEVTESAAMDNLEGFLNTLEKLRAMGFKISIDDFGTGYSSMLYLQNIQPDEIKIDMAFVRNIHLNRGNQHIVKAIVELGHASHASIVAEGVENDAELSFISGLRCDYAQGYYWCPAIPLNEFEEQYLIDVSFIKTKP